MKDPSISLFAGATNSALDFLRIHQDGDGDDGDNHNDDDADDAVELPVLQRHLSLHAPSVSVEQLRLAPHPHCYDSRAGEILRLVNHELQLFSTLQDFVYIARKRERYRCCSP